MRVGSLFSGIGGLDLGLERAGMRVAWQAEINKQCREVLATKFPETHVFEDVKEIDAHPALAVDLLCGGFPCQDVSVAGRRAGLAGERTGLFFEFIRLAEGLGPRWILLENVPGLLSSNDGDDMGTVLATLGDLGYGWAYRVLDAQFFGVPQRRRRVFIVGCLGSDARAAEVLLELEGLCGHPAPSREAGTRVAALTANGVGTCGADDNQGQAGDVLPVPVATATSSGAGWWDESSLAATLAARDWRGGNTIAFHQTQDPISCEEVAPSLGATSSGMGVFNPYRTALKEGGWVEGWKPDDVHDCFTAPDTRRRVDGYRPTLRRVSGA